MNASASDDAAAPSRTRLLWEALSAELGEDTTHAVLRIAKWSARRDAPSEADLTAERWAQERLFPALIDHLPTPAARAMRDRALSILETTAARRARSSDLPDSGFRQRVDSGRTPTNPKRPRARIESTTRLEPAPPPLPDRAREDREDRARRPTVAARHSERATVSPEHGTGVIVWTWDHDLVEALRRRLPGVHAVLLVSTVDELRTALRDSIAGPRPLIVLDRRWLAATEGVELRAHDLAGGLVVLFGPAPERSISLTAALADVRRLVHCPGGAEQQALVETCLALLPAGAPIR